MKKHLPVANSFGNVDVRRGTPSGYVHIPGQRLQPLCRKLGIEFAQALVGWTGRKSHIRASLDGVVVYSKDAERVRSAIGE